MLLFPTKKLLISERSTLGTVFFNFPIDQKLMVLLVEIVQKVLEIS